MAFSHCLSPPAAFFGLSFQSAVWKQHASWIVGISFTLETQQIGELEGIQCLGDCGLCGDKDPYQPRTASLQTYFLILNIGLFAASQMMLVVKNPPANAGDIGDAGLIPASGRSPGEGNGSPFQSSCLETSMDRGACQARVHGVPKSQTRLSGGTTCHRENKEQPSP